MLQAGALASIAGARGPLGCSSDSDSDPANASFLHGVASGDPTGDSVLLWTRVTLDRAGAASGQWEIFDSLEFGEPVANGKFATDEARDYTVKVEASGLLPGATYSYRFRCHGATSPIGRTRTAPEGNVERLRLLVFSCAAYAAGYFHAYRIVALCSDIDIEIHLWD